MVSVLAATAQMSTISLARHGLTGDNRDLGPSSRRLVALLIFWSSASRPMLILAADDVP